MHHSEEKWLFFVVILDRLPVVWSGRKEDFIRESSLYSKIWNKLKKIKLSENMQA